MELLSLFLNLNYESSQYMLSWRHIIIESIFFNFFSRNLLFALIFRNILYLIFNLIAFESYFSFWPKRRKDDLIYFEFSLSNVVFKFERFENWIQTKYSSHIKRVCILLVLVWAMISIHKLDSIHSLIFLISHDFYYFIRNYSIQKREILFFNFIKNRLYFSMYDIFQLNSWINIKINTYWDLNKIMSHSCNYFLNSIFFVKNFGFLCFLLSLFERISKYKYNIFD